MKIYEIFESIQGEGPYVGRRCIFVRCSGCNRRCGIEKSYVRQCDTRYAWEHGIEVTVDQIVDAIVEYTDLETVVITGGEPLIQERAVYELAEELKDRQFEVHLESNGDFDIKVNTFDHVVVSPKTSEVLETWLERWYPDVTIKVVVHEENIDEVMSLVQRWDRRGIYFMPEGYTPLEVIENSQLIVEKMQEYEIDGFLGQRLHIVLGLK